MKWMKETMSTLWDGVVGTMATEDSVGNYVVVPTFLFLFYCVVSKPFFLLDRGAEVLTKGMDENLVKKKKFLDCLAFKSGDLESVSRVDGQELLVRVGDGTETELLRPLMAKTEQGSPEKVTVTVHFSEKITHSGVEKLSESLKKGGIAGGKKEDVAISWLLRATTLQWEVELHDSVLNELESLYKIASDFDPGCTLQVDSWGILMNEGGWQNTLNEVGIPVIFHAEYALGILTIVGKQLKDAEVKISDGRNSLNLGKLQGKGQEIKIRKRYTWDKGGPMCMDYWKLPVRLSTQNIDEVLVYASTKRELADQCVRIHSAAIHVKDALWNTVFARWIVGNLLLTYIIVQVVRAIRFLIESFDLVVVLGWTWTLVSIIAKLLSKDSSRSLIRNTAHGFVRAIRTMYFGAVDLIEREPHLSYSYLTGTKDSSRSSSERRPTNPKPPLPMIVTSESTRTSLNSILKQKNGEKTKKVCKAWEPCIVEKVSRPSGRTELRKVEKDEDDFDAESNPFVVIYRRGEKLSWSDEVNVQVASEHLIKILQKHLPFHGNALCMERPEVPGRDIFVVVDSLSVEGAGIEMDQLSKAQLHLDLLVRYIRKEYKDVSLRLHRLKQERLVTYDMIWAFFSPGQKVVYKCLYTRTLLCATIAERVQYKHGQYGEGPYGHNSSKTLKVLLDIQDFNGRTYGSGSVSREILKYEGERLFESLPVCPINMMTRPQEVLEAEFMAHGRRFYELAMQQRYRFMNYQGSIFCPQRRSKFDSSPRANAQENADGRVMIDTARFFSMNPGFKTDCVAPSMGKFPSSSYQPSDHFDGDMSESMTTPEDLSDEKLMFAPGVVFGFSFALKQWGLFKVSGFSEVVYDANALNELVMEAENKSLIYSLVSQYVTDPQQHLDGIDPISKKGEGCIILCYGPPGTGKTLTAESVAENLRRPLWALSLSQLGTAPEELESALSRVLNIASLWQAIVLLDEADIFLEKRTNNMDLGRNALIGVFLRQLEYYRGIMFLTTNRVSAFDEAVRSRVSMLVCYRQLTGTQRAEVWKGLLSRAGIHDASALGELRSLELNGREIRNVIHTAQVWAKSKNELLQMQHVMYVVGVFTKSLTTLEDAVDNSFLVSQNTRRW